MSRGTPVIIDDGAILDAGLGHLGLVGVARDALIVDVAAKLRGWRSPQAKAARKRARKAAKREEDARRTAEGRDKGAVYWAARMCCDAGMSESGRICMRYPQHGKDWYYPVHSRGYWDLAGFVDRDCVRERFCTPRWRWRLNHRRSLPWVGRHWAEIDGVQWRRAELQTRRMNRRARRGGR